MKSLGIRINSIILHLEYLKTLLHHNPIRARKALKVARFHMGELTERLQKLTVKDYKEEIRPESEKLTPQEFQDIFGPEEKEKNP